MGAGTDDALAASLVSQEYLDRTWAESAHIDEAIAAVTVESANVALRKYLDPAGIVIGTFEMEWPPRSGRRRSFPEVDRAAWFALEQARARILEGQRPLLDALERAILGGPPEVP